MNDYTKIWSNFDAYTQAKNNFSAEQIVLEYLLNNFSIRSLVDFGCATGRWCKIAKQCGIKTILGIDGPYIEKSVLEIEESEFFRHNLEEPITLNRKFDIAISLEVAEHVSKSAAETLVESITMASDLVLFSAAVPGQGGDYHINEQPISFWRSLFEKRGYILQDIIRPVIWYDERVQDYYRQNIVVFSKKEREDLLVKQEGDYIDVIHPSLFLKRKAISLFPFGMVVPKSKIVIWGAGIVGNQYYRQVCMTDFCEKVFWVDSKRTHACVYNKTIELQSKEDIKKENVDYVIIATERESTAQSMINDVRKCMGGKDTNVIWKNTIITRDGNLDTYD